MTRSVPDCAALLDVISGFDARDWSAMPTPTTSFLDGLDNGVAGLRIAFSPNLGFVRNDPEVDCRRARRRRRNRRLPEPKSTRSIRDSPIRSQAFHVLWFSGEAKRARAYGDARRTSGSTRAAADRRDRGDVSAADYLDATAGGWTSAC